jgi:hypothetical protein
VQVEFNDPVENETTNLDITKSKEKVVKTRVDQKHVKRSYSNSFIVGKKLLH